MTVKTQTPFCTQQVQPLVTCGTATVEQAPGHRTFNLEEAAKFLHLHPVTLQRMAKRGEIAAAKLGRRWIFLEVDLVSTIRAQYAPRVMQGEHKEVICRSTVEGIRPRGGSSCTTLAESYREALGLPIK